jgi:gliding motility-associated-like protein
MVKYRKNLNYFSVISYLFLPFLMDAQQSFNGGGIGIKNSFGSVEFSMGQVDYGVSNTVAGIQSMGIQQPFFVIKPGAITSLLCDSLTFVGDAILEKEEYMGGVFIAYKGGNGGFIKGSNINSLNVNGLIATIHPTNLAKGNGLLELSISGVPSGTGLAYFNISVGGKNCLIEVPVKEERPMVSNLNCGNILVEPPAIGVNQAFNGKINIQYSKTNGKIFPTDTISIKNSNASFKLMANKTKLALDEGVLTFDLIGKADKKGWLEFKIKVVDEECPVRIIISENEMDAPNFFSPNEDGVNEYWYVPALAFYPKAKIIIFDRYGKIISTLDGTQSWNGTMNGIPMASGDYWYTIQLDQKLPPLKGNITLIR